MRIILPIIALVIGCCWALTSRVEQTEYLPMTPATAAAWTRINAAAAAEKAKIAPPPPAPATQPIAMSDVSANDRRPTTRPAGT